MLGRIAANPDRDCCGLSLSSEAGCSKFAVLGIPPALGCVHEVLCPKY